MADASRRGRFITLEGVDGAGKSTHIPWIAQRLRDAGHAVVVTREPGGTPVAEKLREIVLSQPMDAVAETLLLFAARADHVRQVIAPALERGDWVVCDRFGDATLAYQGAGNGVSAALIGQLAQAAHGGLEPDCTFFFDCPYEVSRKRLAAASRTLDRFESEDQAFFERVRGAYLKIAQREPGRVKRIDGSASIDVIRAELERHLEFASGR
jgi:dTMP kinase